jgi:hypothetical protein
MLMCERFRLVEILDDPKINFSVPSPLVGEGEGGG